jgi:hypothetical protein
MGRWALLLLLLLQASCVVDLEPRRDRRVADADRGPMPPPDFQLDASPLDVSPLDGPHPDLSSPPDGPHPDKAPPPDQPPQPPHGTQVFGFQTGPQSFTVPGLVTLVEIKAWGGGGGSALERGGGGGFAYAKIPVTPGETLGIWVASGGDGDGKDWAGGGGGASIVRRGGTVLLVAGGGGGAGADGCGGCDSNYSGAGGGGGGGTGGNASCPSYSSSAKGGGGGTSGGGGGGGSGPSSNGASGGQLQGGHGHGNGGETDGGTESLGGSKLTQNGAGGGGGSGWYGGGGGGNGLNSCGAGGGGGSSYAFSGASNVTLTAASGWQAANSGDSQWASGVGDGGPTAKAGDAGRVVVNY